MIEFIGVTKSYKTDFWAKYFDALNNVSFKIKEGELIGFLGANGAGKTTTIKIMLGFIRQSGGTVIYGPQLGKNLQDVLSNIGFMPERPYFYPYLTGRQFIKYMAELSKVSPRDIKQRTEKWSKRFRIDHALDRKIRGHSKGMLQRLGFVLSLIHDPPIMILDEPLSGLDPLGRKEIKDVLRELAQEGKTIFFSSHIVSDVEEICQKVIVLEKGQLLYEGSIGSLVEKNIRPNYFIRVYSERVLEVGKLAIEISGISEKNLSLYQVKNEDKDVLVSTLLAQGGQLMSLYPERPTLEEIIYEIRS